ncbi:TPA: restriction endonuclease subunit S [Streptococcus suis]
MPNKDRNIPKRRFKEFENEDAWELRKLGEITEKQFGGGTPTTSNALFWEGNIPWIQSSDLEEGIFSVGPRKYITKDGLGNSSAQLIPKNSIAIVTRVGVGKLAFMPFTYTTSQDFLSISYLKTNELFTTYSLYIKLQNEIKVLQGTSIKGITKNELLIKEIPIPSFPEQEAIGTFFSTLDRHITLHQRKLDKLKHVKQAYLSEMFPAEGERVPKRRFPGFTDDWELRPLGEIGNTYTGLSGKTKDDFGHGDGRFVTYMNVFSNPISLPEMVEAVEIDESQNTVRYGDVLFTTSSETPEEVGMSSVWLGNTENTYLNSFCFGFRPVKKVNPYYLAYLLRSSGMRRKISFLAQGISRYNISKTKIMELEISIPNENEQKAIGTFFSTLDQQITLHQRKLEKLKNLKKALLNELFV